MTPQQWYYRKGTARFGPVSGSDIKKMAADGKLEPTDLLRGVGMTEWIPASKIKGLFTKPAESTAPKPIPKPKGNAELGLAPLETVKPAETPKSIVNVAKTVAVKPIVKKPAKPTTIPQPDVSNPFAQFGLESTPTVPNDPFAAVSNTMPNIDFGATPNIFDNLTALEKQSQAIYREPTVAVEPDPFAVKAKTQTATSSVSDFGPGGYIAFMAAPFLFVLLICFPIGVITAWVPLRIAAFAIAVGTSKMVGLIAGNCMLKVKIKNEVLALAYGGLVGLFVTYVFVAASFWTYINVTAFLVKASFQHAQTSAPREMDEDGRSLVLRPDERPQFPDPDQPPPPPPDTENAEDNADEEEKKEGENEEFSDEEEWTPNNNDSEMKQMQDRMELMERLFGKGVSLFESVSPFTLLKFVRFELNSNTVVGYLFYWLLMGGILVAITAHSTWMANLGSDPTRSGGF